MPDARPSPPSAPTLAEAEAALRRHWGHERFRPGQAEAVEAVLKGEDVLAVLPTGGGKSVCYQVPAVVLGGLTVVVSPLVALMEDQVAGLRARGVAATFLHAAVPYREAEQRWTDAEFGRYRLLYLAPERLASETFRARAPRLPIARLAIDEAHCISEWGHDFRPSYLRLAEAAEHLGRPPLLAVTATATPRVREEIVRALGLRSPRLVVRGFDRPNLVPSVFHVEDKRARLLEVVRAVPGSAIVYAATRRGTEAWAETLRGAGVAAEAYHAGLPAATRTAVQERWQEGATRVVTATSAFGMGVDKPDVRLVAHVDLPPSVEAYYQEAGRGGRDGATAYAVLLVAPGDEAAALSFAEEGHPEAADVQAVYTAACSLAQIPLGSAGAGPAALDLERVAEVAGCSPMRARAAAEALFREGVWEALPARPERGLVRFRQPAEAVRRYAEGLPNEALAAFVRELLRGVEADAFSGWSDLDLCALGRRTGLGRGRLLRGLAFLAERGLLAYHAEEEAHSAAGRLLRFRLAGPRTQSVPLDVAALRRSRRRAEARLADVRRYARALSCRRHFLLGYFGEPAPAHCGRCDVCLGRHRPALVTPEDEPALRRLLAETARGARPEDLHLEGLPAHRTVGLLDWLLHEGYLRVSDPLAGTLALTPAGQRMIRMTSDSSNG